MFFYSFHFLLFFYFVFLFFWLISFTFNFYTNINTDTSSLFVAQTTTDFTCTLLCDNKLRMVSYLIWNVNKIKVNLHTNTHIKSHVHSISVSFHFRYSHADYCCCWRCYCCQNSFTNAGSNWSDRTITYVNKACDEKRHFVNMYSKLCVCT